ncbi:ras-related protein ORAB-1-like [Littorina saxatilis]|uniref:ras-related protein ORAB-1-like n=1 Tax=Littorina saxatilis TaxID=31220 RepID=UPI0038B5BC65
MADYTTAKYDAIYKVTVIGDSQVGKTSIIRKFVDHNAPDHYPPTIGVDFGIKDIMVDNEKCRVQIWDTAGQERFRAVTSCYFRGAHGVVLVYDVTQARTFDNIQFHLAQAVKFTRDDQPMIMVGNKCDLTHKRAVSYELAERYAEAFGMQLIETSALNLTNIEQVFVRLIHQIREKKKKEKECGGGGGGKGGTGGGDGGKTKLFGSGGTIEKTYNKCCS